LEGVRGILEEFGWNYRDFRRNLRGFRGIWKDLEKFGRD